MKVQELHQLSDEELTTRIHDMVRAYYRIAEEVASGKEKNVSQLKHLRRDVARARTVVRTRLTPVPVPQSGTVRPSPADIAREGGVSPRLAVASAKAGPPLEAADSGPRRLTSQTSSS